MNCEQVREAIWNGEDRQTFAAHLKTCEACREEWEQHRTFMEAVADTEVPMTSKSLLPPDEVLKAIEKRNRRKRWNTGLLTATAAVLVLWLGFAAVGRGLPSNGDLQQGEKNVVDTPDDREKGPTEEELQKKREQQVRDQEKWEQEQRKLEERDQLKSYQFVKQFFAHLEAGNHEAAERMLPASIQQSEFRPEGGYFNPVTEQGRFEVEHLLPYNRNIIVKEHLDSYALPGIFNVDNTGPQTLTDVTVFEFKLTEEQGRLVHVGKDENGNWVIPWEPNVGFE